jgi:hypothetical protein
MISPHFAVSRPASAWFFRAAQSALRDGGLVLDCFITAVRAREQSGRGIHRVSPGARPVPGAVLQIVCGLRAGLEAAFQYESPERRVIVLMSLLGSCEPGELPAAGVEAPEVFGPVPFVAFGSRHAVG